MKLVSRKLVTSAILMSSALLSNLSYADEVNDAISLGVSHYKKGELSQAAGQLDYASTLIRQQKADQIMRVFPEALSGWSAEKAENDSAAGAMFGGGISANRQYTKGDKSVEIELAVDSPLLQTMMGMFSNPSMIAMSGAKLIKVQGHKAMLTEDEGEIGITLIVNHNALFTVTGYDVSVDHVKAYAEKIKLEQL